MQSDVKMYQTFIRIDGELVPDGDDPIEAKSSSGHDRHRRHQRGRGEGAGSHRADPGRHRRREMGATREVFVKTATGHDRRQVKLGLYNETMVEIREASSRAT